MGVKPTMLLAAVEGTELVTVRVANIGQVHRPHGVVARSRRVFDRDAAIRNGRIVKFTHLLWRFALEADGAAVGMGRRLSVDRLADTKTVAFLSKNTELNVRPENPDLRFSPQRPTTEEGSIIFMTADSVLQLRSGHRPDSVPSSVTPCPNT